MAIGLFIFTVLIVLLLWRRIVPALRTDPGPADPVAEAGEESFPCSDPPAWTLGLSADRVGESPQGDPK